MKTCSFCGAENIDCAVICELCGHRFEVTVAKQTNKPDSMSNSESNNEVDFLKNKPNESSREHKEDNALYPDSEGRSSPCVSETACEGSQEDAASGNREQEAMYSVDDSSALHPSRTSLSDTTSCATVPYGMGKKKKRFTPVIATLVVVVVVAATMFHIVSTNPCVFGHSYDVTRITPSCTVDGHTMHVCSRCGYTFVYEVIEALGHNWDKNTLSCSRCTMSLSGYYIGTNGEYSFCLESGGICYWYQSGLRFTGEVEIVNNTTFQLLLDGQGLYSDTIFSALLDNTGFYITGGTVNSELFLPCEKHDAVVFGYTYPDIMIGTWTGELGSQLTLNPDGSCYYIDANPTSQGSGYWGVENHSLLVINTSALNYEICADIDRGYVDSIYVTGPALMWQNEEFYK